MFRNIILNTDSKLKQLISNICFKDCHNKYFHQFKYEYIYANKLTINNNNGIYILTNSGKSLNLYDVKKLQLLGKTDLYLIKKMK